MHEWCQLFWSQLQIKASLEVVMMAGESSPFCRNSFPLRRTRLRGKVPARRYLHHGLLGVKAWKGLRERFTLPTLPTRHLSERSVLKFVGVEQPTRLPRGWCGDECECRRVTIFRVFCWVDGLILSWLSGAEVWIGGSNSQGLACEAIVRFRWGGWFYQPLQGWWIDADLMSLMMSYVVTLGCSGQKWPFRRREQEGLLHLGVDVWDGTIPTV